MGIIQGFISTRRHWKIFQANKEGICIVGFVCELDLSGKKKETVGNLLMGQPIFLLWFQPALGDPVGWKTRGEGGNLLVGLPDFF